MALKFQLAKIIDATILIAYWLDDVHVACTPFTIKELHSLFLVTVEMELTMNNPVNNSDPTKKRR
jgi:hypothetical protein